ncbi:LysR substrate-binding domain-containing protein [Cupriavidus necator]|uniref:LysR family transcriptional regulator n=1 Tax=Cupriavidus necator TaxID=106590 RepID=UPI0039C48D0C
MPIDIRALRYFVETARLQSFTGAARSLFVTQSTISKMVRQLEDEIGKPLLVRDGKTAFLTDVGKVVYERGLEALGVVHRLTLEVADLAALGRGQLTVGLSPMANLFFSPAVSTFRKRYPNLELNLAEHGGHLIEKMVAAGELEVGATVLPGEISASLSTRQFAKYPIWAVGPPEASWAGSSTVQLRALKDEPLILLTDEFSLTHRIRQAFVDARPHPKVVAQSGHWEFLASMAQAGLGTTFLPEPFLSRLAPRDKLSLARLTEPEIDWALAHIWLAGRYLSHAARAWLSTCNEVLGVHGGLPCGAPAQLTGEVVPSA